MADRTFSAEDVIRIFEDHLDGEEQERVQIFFLPEVDIDSEILEFILALLLSLVSALTSPLVGFVVGLLSQATQQAYNTAVDELFRTNRALDRQIRRINA